MKSHRSLWACALLFACVLPVFAQDVAEGAEDSPVAESAEEQTILGVWYIQRSNDRYTPADRPKTLTLGEDGTLVLEMGGDPRRMAFVLDPDNATLTVTEDSGEAYLLAYRLQDGMLRLESVDELGNPDGSDVMELTRNPEGTQTHQRIRAEIAAAPRPEPDMTRRMDMMQRMLNIMQGVRAYAADHNDKAPDSLGELVVQGYIQVADTFVPGSEQPLPNGYPVWQDAQRMEWINAHTTFAYFGAGHRLGVDMPEVLVMELPPHVYVRNVQVLRGVGGTTGVRFEELDEQLTEQTGHGIAQWMETASPGSGEMVLPAEQERGGAE